MIRNLAAFVDCPLGIIRADICGDDYLRATIGRFI